MRRDARNLPVTGADASIIEAIDRFTDDLLCSREGTGAVAELAERAPGCLLAQAYAASLAFYAQSTREIRVRARPLIDRALALRPGATERERLLVEALDAWASSDLGGALGRFERITADWPSDLVVAKLAELLFFEAPDHARHLRFMEALAPANQQSSPLLAMHSFALELTNHMGRAEAVARRAVALDRQTPWAHHALAHVFLAQGRVAEGLAELGALAPLWAPHSASVRAHNAWHLAVLHLSALDVGAALRLLREQIWGSNPGSAAEQEDAISLLWRAELAGADVGDLWSGVAPRVRMAGRESSVLFLTAHCVYALARAGEREAADEVIEQAALRAASLTGRARFVWGHVGLPLLRGCAAFALGDHAAAASHLDPVIWDAACVGGSDAQNDVFAQTYLLALTGSGRRAEARRLLLGRVGGRSPTPLEARWLGMV